MNFPEIFASLLFIKLANEKVNYFLQRVSLFFKKRSRSTLLSIQDVKVFSCNCWGVKLQILPFQKVDFFVFDITWLYKKNFISADNLLKNDFNIIYILIFHSFSSNFLKWHSFIQINSCTDELSKCKRRFSYWSFKLT